MRAKLNVELLGNRVLTNVNIDTVDIINVERKAKTYRNSEELREAILADVDFLLEIIDNLNEWK